MSDFPSSRLERGALFARAGLKVGSNYARHVARKALIREARLARRSKEDCYLVAAFGRPVEKVVVLPANKAVRMKRITAQRGGIPWER